MFPVCKRWIKIFSLFHTSKIKFCFFQSSFMSCC